MKILLISLFFIISCNKKTEVKREYKSGIVLNSFCGTYKNVEIDCAQRYIPSYAPEEKYKLSPEQIKKGCMKYIDANKEWQKRGMSCCQMNGGPFVIQGAFIKENE